MLCILYIYFKRIRGQIVHNVYLKNLLMLKSKKSLNMNTIQCLTINMANKYKVCTSVDTFLEQIYVMYYAAYLY